MTTEIFGHTLQDWEPTPPLEGPPLPEFWHIYWPWYHAPNISLQDGTVTFNFVAPTPAITAITITGNPVNITPGQAIAFAPGTYPWTAKAEGYADGGGTFVVKPNQPTTVNVQLTATTAQNGTLVVNYNVTGAIVVVSSITVTASGQTLTFPVDSYEWSASAPNYDSQQGTVTIVQGVNPPLNITLLPSATNPTTGTAVITFTPATASVYLNGNPVNSGQYPPGTIWTFNPGTYPWSVSASGYVTQSGTFTIVAGQQTTIGPINLVLSTGIVLPPGTGWGIIPSSLLVDSAGVHFDLANWDLGIPTGGRGEVACSSMAQLIKPYTIMGYDASTGYPELQQVTQLNVTNFPPGVLLPPVAQGTHLDIPWSKGTLSDPNTGAILDSGQNDYQWLEQNGYLSTGFTLDIYLFVELFTSQGYMTEQLQAPTVSVPSNV